jgi:hypothetical protein
MVRGATRKHTGLWSNASLFLGFPVNPNHRQLVRQTDGDNLLSLPISNRL